MYEFRSSRYRLYPNRAQAVQFRQLCGASRYVYNTLLGQQIEDYERYRAGDGEKPDASAYGLGRQFIRLRHRDGHDWLEPLSCQVVRASGAFRLGAAFGHFFRRVKEAEAEPGFPRFKAKGLSRESFIIPEAVRLERKRLRVPKVGWVRLNRKAERFACRACGHRDHADGNAARNILGLGLNKLLAGGAPVTGRGGDNETGGLLCEWRHLVETAHDPSRHLPWNLPRLDPG